MCRVGPADDVEMHLTRIATGAVLATMLTAATAAGSGGSPFNGHYVGKSADGRHHVDINIDDGAVRTTNLRLTCPGRPGFGDFGYRAGIARDGSFTVWARGSGSGRPVTLRIAAEVARGVIRGRLTAQVGSCFVSRVQFTARRQGR